MLQLSDYQANLDRINSGRLLRPVESSDASTRLAEKCVTLGDVAKEHTDRNNRVQEFTRDNPGYVPAVMVAVGTAKESLSGLVEDAIAGRLEEHQERTAALLRLDRWRKRSFPASLDGDDACPERRFGIVNFLINAGKEVPGLSERYPSVRFMDVERLRAVRDAETLLMQCVAFLRGKASAARGYAFEKRFAAVLKHFDIDLTRNWQPQRGGSTWDFLVARKFAVETTFVNATGSVISRKKNALIADIQASKKQDIVFVFAGGGRAWTNRQSDLREIAANFHLCITGGTQDVADFVLLVLNHLGREENPRKVTLAVGRILRGE